jgi:hypothetical protein
VLEARRFRNWFAYAGLSVATLVGAKTALAQTPGPGRATQPGSGVPPASLVDPRPPLGDPGQGALSSSLLEGSDAEKPEAPVRDRPLHKPPETARWFLIGTGLGTTGLFYAGAWGIRGIWPDARHHDDLRVPVAGPFMDLSHTGCPLLASGSCSTFELVIRTILVSFDAIGQVGGVALVLQGAVLGTANAEAPRSNLAAERSRSAKSLVILPSPWLDGKGGGGVGLVGQF